MRANTYPFSAIVGQEQMKLALMLAAVDWRLSVLLRGDKGSGKTTTARGLAELLPAPAPFVNLPIGATEDRLLGGLDLERALRGEPVLKPGLLSQAHSGVLYVDEINLLPAHLGDALLDAAASGVHVVEREGLSVSHAAEFVLLGSMNPEEGSLRPQLLDRFALCVEIEAPLDPVERSVVVERRIAYERHREGFANDWMASQETLRAEILNARRDLQLVHCPTEVLGHISRIVCDYGVRSLRADLAAVRAATAYAALQGAETVFPEHIEHVLPLVLAHRMQDRGRQPPRPPASAPPSSPASDAQPPSLPDSAVKGSGERVFASSSVETPTIRVAGIDNPRVATGSGASAGQRGPVVRARRSETPVELDVRATVSHALREKGEAQVQRSDLYERVRRPSAGIRYLFVIDSSGSHAAQERMRQVKGAVSSLLTRSFKREDEIVILLFRGTSAQVILEPTQTLPDALSALEYLPTGGRTPLAHALESALSFVTPSTFLVLLTDGRANVSVRGGDPWHEALEAARLLVCPALVIDTEDGANALGQTGMLADALGARCVSLHELGMVGDLRVEMAMNGKVPAR